MLLEEEGRVLRPLGRVYTSNYGPTGVLAAEWEFESVAACQKFWADWYAKPETPAFVEKWLGLLEPGGGSEIWN